MPGSAEKGAHTASATKKIVIRSGVKQREGYNAASTPTSVQILSQPYAAPALSAYQAATCMFRGAHLVPSQLQQRHTGQLLSVAGQLGAAASQWRLGIHQCQLQQK